MVLAGNFFYPHSTGVMAGTVVICTWVTEANNQLDSQNTSSTKVTLLSENAVKQKPAISWLL
jgi:hypothetical protein